MTGTAPIRSGLAALLWVFASATLDAQPATLSLDEALGRALANNPSLTAAAAAAEEGEAREDQARARWLPRVDYTESFLRSDDPVYVFGTLLRQGSFTEENFALDSLNHPDALNLFQSQFRLRQVLFDRGVQIGIAQAKLGSERAQQAHRQAEMGVLFDTVRRYFGLQVTRTNLDVARQAVETAEEDLARTRALFEGGQVTEADVLSLQVHLASLRENRIRAENAVEIARGELNRVLGTELDVQYRLTTELDEGRRASGGELAEGSPSSVEELRSTTLTMRPESRQAALSEQMAENEKQMAVAAFLPSLVLDAGWESDRVSFLGDGGTNWLLGVGLRINLFDGRGKLAKSREADAALRRARAERRDLEQSLLLEVRQASLELDAARKTVDVTRDSLASARESHRILRVRYESGLATLTDLLRSQNALLSAEAADLGARYQSRIAQVRLALATGTLDRDAEVLKP